MVKVNKNITDIKTPPIDYFNNLLRIKSNNKFKSISFGHGIPMYTPNNYYKFSKNPLLDDSSYKYTEIRGDQRIRQYISTKLNSKCSFPVKSDNLIITSGANSAIFKSLFLQLQYGDEVIIPSPVYFNHTMAIEMIGGTVVEVNSIAESGFQLNLKGIQNKINSKTKAIIINTPNNPTGATYNNDDMKILAQICDKKNITIVLDYTYEDFSYNLNYNPLASFEHLKNLIIIGSFSKTFGITGLRLGYICASKSIIEDLCKIQDTISICAPSISQNILLQLLFNENDAIKMNFNSASNSRDKLIECLNDSKILNWQATNGAFYAFIKIPNTENTWDFCEKMIIEYSLLVLPGSIFGEHWKSYIRIAYGAVSPKEIEEGVQRLYNQIGKTT
tara:strand:- start:880 stop:2046 length:1167 start_codon:yes stop_codon:yes gene_type:complete